ncbi:hypothetical protein [Micromonospora sp. CPCC 206061]|uniref:hypothetical protein n=1 Tax=Micromonospora sp. CPCC 206061 TaxID=3122410 RepID=UPI002FF1DBF7
MEPNGEAEEHLLAGFRRGETTDLGPGEPADPAFGLDSWPPKRVVRAEFVRALLLDAEMLEPSHPRLVSLAGAQIVGALRLSNLELTVDLELRRCYFTEPVVLTNLSARDLDFTGCRMPNLAASGLAAGLVELAGARTGQIDLRRARIRDDLSLDAATIGDESYVDDPDYLALYADGLAVEGHLTATGLAAAGQIRLVGARITGSLGLNHAHIANPAGVGVDASRITVEGGVYATVEIDGELVLTGAAIGTLLSLLEARLSAPHGRPTQEPGWAVRAGGLTVDGHLIANGVQLTGWTEFQAAVVRGVFEMDRVSIGPHPSEAVGMLDLTGMEAQSLSLRDGRLNTFLKLDRLRVAGNVTLTNSTIGPEIAETGPDWPGLSADAATVAGTFSLEGVYRPAASCPL